MMKLYKYRDFSAADESRFAQLEEIVFDQRFWCARPDTLNDPEEFSWGLDLGETAETRGLVEALLLRERGLSAEVARDRVAAAFASGLFEHYVGEVVADMVGRCRDEFGLICFGTSADNLCLWQRYAGDGAGVCVELEVPSALLGKQLHRVHYLPAKTMHVDDYLRVKDPEYMRRMFSLALLSKPAPWLSEAEIRFISKRHGVSVYIYDSKVTGLYLGHSLAPAARARVVEMAQRGGENGPVPCFSGASFAGS